MPNGGFAGGLAQGIESGLDIRTKNQQLAQQQQQLNQQATNKRFGQNMQVLNSLISAGASDEVIDDYLQTKIVPDSDNLLDGITFTSRAGEAGKFLSKAFTDHQKRIQGGGNERESLQTFAQTLQVGFAKFPKQAAAIKAQLEDVQRQQQAGAGVTALGPEATESELAQLQAGEDVGEVLGRRPKPSTFTEIKGEILARLSDEDQEKFLLKPNVQITLPKPASAGERTAIAGTRASIDSLSNLKTLYDESFTGPFQGRKGAVANILGLNPAKQEAFIAATAAFRNQVIKDITGAQMSEPEAKRILKQVPNENDADSVWLAKYEQSIRNLKALNDRRLEVLRQSELRVPEGEGAEDLSTLSNEELLKRIGQ